MKFTRKYNLIMHEKYVHERLLFSCNLCDYKAARNIQVIHHKLSVHEGRKDFKCEICNHSTVSKYNLKAHMKQIHENIKYECSMCESQYTSKTALSNHIAKVHTKTCKEYKCHICDYKTNFKQLLKIHVDGIHEGITYQCSIPSCGSVFKYQANMRAHIKNIHGRQKRKYSCDKCEFKADRRSLIDQHIQSQHLGKMFKCDQCEKTFAMKHYVSLHKTIVHKDKNLFYYCDICGYKSRAKRTIQIHREKIHEGKTYSCPQCGRVFNQRCNKLRHMLTVHKNGEQWHSCQYCTCKFKSTQALKNHVSKRHEERSYTCQNCIFVTKEKAEMVQHKKTHAVNECNKCGRKFKRPWSLKIHVEAVHEGKKAKCEICSFETSSTSHLRKHKIKMHDQIGSFVCYICNEGFATEQNLDKHKKRHKCDLCEFESSLTDLVKKHKIEKHIGIPRFQCNICTVSYSRNGNLKKHKREIHQELLKGLTFKEIVIGNSS